VAAGEQGLFIVHLPRQNSQHINVPLAFVLSDPTCYGSRKSQRLHLASPDLVAATYGPTSPSKPWHCLCSSSEASKVLCQNTRPLVGALVSGLKFLEVRSDIGSYSG
jgi:hypothetical protein